MPRFDSKFTEEDAANEDAIDAWHEGYYAIASASAPYTEAFLRDAWNEGRREAQYGRRVVVQMVERPEGYYHAPLNDF